MKVYQTNRLFYGKWLYRIETSVPGASLIKRWGPDAVRDYCNNPNDKRYPRLYAVADKVNLLKYVNTAEHLLDKELQLRAEWNTLNFYLKDLDLYYTIQETLKEWVISVTEPASDDDIDSLLAKSSLVLCDEFPHGKFHYRVYIRYQMPPPQRISFLNWLEEYTDDVRPSKSTRKWLENGSPYLQDPFVHITDRNQLLMVTLFLGGYAKSTQEFVLRNTVK